MRYPYLKLAYTYPSPLRVDYVYLYHDPELDKPRTFVIKTSRN